jgi:hypothetical protein
MIIAVSADFKDAMKQGNSTIFKIFAKEGNDLYFVWQSYIIKLK